MRFNFLLIKAMVCCIPLSGCTQSTDTTKTTVDTVKVDLYAAYHNQWRNLADGLDYIEMDAPKKSFINDSRISILKINPAKVEFKMLSASQFDSVPLCAVDWAEKFNLNVVINASMYDLGRKLSSKGLLQNDDKYSNNPTLYPGYNAMIAFNPKHSSKPNFTVFDLKCDNWDLVKKDYSSYAQGLRMIDCNGDALGWNKKEQSCSMLVVAVDDHQNIYYIFSRSPYSHNQMIDFMRNFEFRLINAIYMEGGPQTSLFINVGDKRIEKLGSYVSRTFPNDNNAEYWNLPNVIGVKLK